MSPTVRRILSNALCALAAIIITGTFALPRLKFMQPRHTQYAATTLSPTSTPAISMLDTYCSSANQQLARSGNSASVQCDIAHRAQRAGDTSVCWSALQRISDMLVAAQTSTATPTWVFDEACVSQQSTNATRGMSSRRLVAAGAALPNPVSRLLLSNSTKAKNALEYARSYNPS